MANSQLRLQQRATFSQAGSSEHRINTRMISNTSNRLNATDKTDKANFDELIAVFSGLAGAHKLA